jgi:hypothetical protein
VQAWALLPHTSATEPGGDSLISASTIVVALNAQPLRRVDLADHLA